MAAFLIGLQFLTRIRVVAQTEWSAENFGNSVKYFPLIGAILGAILAALGYLFYFFLPQFGLQPPQHITALAIVIAGILLTGGLHCDGFMDTADGVFSGRPRERMLEIMKDSRVGANGVIAFCLLALSKWALVLDLPPQQLPLALFLMPVLGRLAMVMGVTLFPYARPEGIGKAFAEYANKKSFYFAFLVALFCVLCGSIINGGTSLFCLAAVLVFAWIFAGYITRVLGGLTGDVYGALTELSELLVLLIFCL